MAITDGIITLEDAQASIYGASITAPTGTAEDIERYIEAATPVIENIAGPVIERERVFTFNGGSNNYPLPVRVQSVDEVEVGGVVVAASGYDVDVESGIIWFDSHTTYGIQNLVVTCTVGYANDEYPANIILATRELVRFWWQQGRQANRPGVAEQDSSSTAPMGFLVPKRVRELLEPTPGLPGFA